ncbi:FHA domain-containing protein kinase [Myxococcota bacterium]|nr:FHA domain-containing protein kinase [Myxococcota bacterium]
MPLVRVRVEYRGRVELHEVEGPDVELGRDRRADVVLHHESVAPRHARLMLRRGRLILADLGLAKQGTTRGRERLFAPVALAEGEPFGVGEVSLAAWSVAPGDEGLSQRSIETSSVGVELESADPGARRYRVQLDDGARAELAIARPELRRVDAEAWLAKARATGPGRPPQLVPLAWWGVHERSPYLIERLPEGLRLAQLLDGVARGALTLPLEAVVVIIAQLAEAVAAFEQTWGVHGSLDPRMVHLGLEGAVVLLRPGPLATSPRAIEDAYLAPERRFGLPPTPSSDAFALGVLGKAVLGRRRDCPVRLRALCYWLAHVTPTSRPRDLTAIAAELRDAAQAASLDPTAGHVARAVRLLAPNLVRPLCTVRGPGGATPSDIGV